MGLEHLLRWLATDDDVPTHRLRGWISQGPVGWHDEVADLIAVWRTWRGDRSVNVVTTVRGTPTVVELEVAGTQTSPATLVWDERTSPAEARIYVDPEATT